MNVQQVPQHHGAPGGIRQGTAREFLAVVFRRRLLILGLLFATTATVFVIALTTPIVYVSSGRLLVRRGEKESVLQANREIYSQWEEELGSEVEVVKSWDVSQIAQQRLDAQPGAKIKLVTGQVDAEVMGKSNVIAVAYEDRDPEVARRVASALIEAYIQFKKSHLSLNYPRQFFDQEIAGARAELQRLHETRRDFTHRNGVIQLQEQQRAQLALQEVLTQRHSDAASELASARAELRSMRALQTSPGVDMPALGLSASAENALGEIKRRIVDQEAHLARMRESYRDDSQEVLNAQATLETLKAMLRRDVEARITVAATRGEALQAKLASIQRDLATVKSELSTMPEKEAFLAQLDRDMSIAKTRYEDLLVKARSAQINEFTSAPMTLVVLSPPGPGTPRNTRDYVRLALAPAFSLVVGIGLAFFIDGLDLTVRTSSHAEEAAELPVLAAITERRRRRRTG